MPFLSLAVQKKFLKSGFINSMWGKWISKDYPPPNKKRSPHLGVSHLWLFCLATVVEALGITKLEMVWNYHSPFFITWYFFTVAKVGGCFPVPVCLCVWVGTLAQGTHPPNYQNSNKKQLNIEELTVIP